MKTIIAKVHFNPIAVAVSAAIGVTSSLQAVAVDNGSQPGDSSSAAVILQEVMVYGTKQSTAQAAQDVAGQVGAFDAAQLEARQVVSIEDLAFSNPNANLSGFGTYPTVASFFIRGQGIASSIPSIDPSVGVFVDGIYKGVTYGVVTDTFDLESVEVHKGPQGVLFGRNVSAGAVLLRSARPDGKFGVKAKTGMEVGGEESQYTTAFSVQGSLIEDSLAAKLSVYHKDDGGYFKSNLTGDALGENRTQVERATLVYTPDDRVDLTLIYEHGTTDGDGLVSPEIEAQDARNHGDTSNSDQNYTGLSDNEWSQVTFESGFDLGGGRITNILGYHELDSMSRADPDTRSLDIITSSNLLQHQVSNELRYNVSPNEQWDLTIGGYYFQQTFRLYADMNAFGNVTAGGGLQEQKTKGLFVNNVYALTDFLTLSAGIRYTREDKKVKVWPRTPTSGCSVVPGGGKGYCENNRPFTSDAWSNVAPKLGLQWQLKEDSKLYAHWSRAYRSGMYNMRTPVSGPPRATDVEETNSIEIGLKSTVLDGRLRLNAALFQNQIEGFVIEAMYQDPITEFPVQDFLNAGDATVNGFEFDATYMVNENLVLNAGLGLLDGEYDNVSANLDGSIDPDTGLAETFAGPEDEDLVIKYMTERTATVGISYEIAIADAGSLTARADYSYRSKAPYSDSNKTWFPSYKQANLGLSYRPIEGDWRINFYAKNLTDRTVVGGVVPVIGHYASPMKKGRRLGLEFIYEI